MQPFQPNFNQIQAPGVSPQNNAEQIDLGINRVAAEFSRQESGMRQNLQAMAENQKAMQRSMKTQMDRSQMDWKNYEKLADFSSTIADELVENQKKVNERVKIENMNQAFLDGADPYKQAKYNEEVEKLNKADDATLEVAKRYRDSGGLPDVAYEIERRSGWAAYGYAVGIAQNGAKNYSNFLEENKNIPVGERPDGSEITLENSQTSAEYLATTKLLRTQYMAPYAGLNPELLQEHLITPMRSDEDIAFAEWEQEFSARKEKERNLTQQAELFGIKDKPQQAANLTEQMIQKEAIRNGGNYKVATQTIAKYWQNLAENGSLSVIEAQAMLDQYVDTRAGKKRLGDTPEGRAILASATTYENQKYNREDIRNRQLVKQKTDAMQKQIIDKGYLPDKEREEFIEGLVQEYNADRDKLEQMFPKKNEIEADMAADEINALVNANAYVPEGLIGQLTARYSNLAVEARKMNQARRVNMGLTEKNARRVKNKISSLARKSAGTIGTTAEANDEAVSAAARAEEDAQSWLAANREKYETEAAAVEALEDHLKDQFEKQEFTDANGVKQTGYDASPYNSANNTIDEDRQADFRKKRDYATNHIYNLVQQGEKNPYALGAIPGTKEELMLVKAVVEQEGRILPGQPVFMRLAEQSNGTATYEEIVKSQLKSVYNIDFDAQYGPQGVDFFECKTGVEMRDVRRLLNDHPTPNTRIRAGLDVGMAMPNASQQGALSDPNDPNSPRIGQFVGGDGDQVAQGQGGGYTINLGAIPSGWGGVVQSAADEYGIDATILAGLIDAESTWDPYARSGVGAKGLGQFMDDTAAEHGVNVNDPVSSIQGAARYLRYLIDYFDGDVKKAIYAYNGGMGNIRYYNGPIPGNRENQEYYDKVIQKSKKYRRKAYRGLRSNYQARVADSPYNSPDLLSPNLRGRIYQLA
jgi:hypothetical protein